MSQRSAGSCTRCTCSNAFPEVHTYVCPCKFWKVCLGIIQKKYLIRDAFRNHCVPFFLHHFTSIKNIKFNNSKPVNLLKITTWYLTNLSMIKGWKELVPAYRQLAHHKLVNINLRNTNTFFYNVLPTCNRKQDFYKKVQNQK